MGMTARETLQALLDGKIIIGSNGYLWKLDENDELVQRKPKREIWEGTYSVFNGDCEIYKEYPLTFEQALRAMLDGKTVMHESCGDYAYRLHNGVFESSCSADEFAMWGICGLSGIIQTDMWKVVE